MKEKAKLLNRLTLFRGNKHNRFEIIQSRKKVIPPEPEPVKKDEACFGNGWPHKKAFRCSCFFLLLVTIALVVIIVLSRINESDLEDKYSELKTRFESLERSKSTK